MKRFALSLALILCFLALRPRAAFACSCYRPDAPEAALVGATAVFAGKVISIDPDPAVAMDEVDVTFDVSSAWKGIDAATTHVRTSPHGASCGYQFEVGQEYLVYARGDANQLQAGLCDRILRAADAGDDLSVLGPGRVFAAPDLDAPAGGLSPVLCLLPALAGLGVAGVFAASIRRRRSNLPALFGRIRLRFALNPVLIKELRGRMRGPRAYLFLSATLALFGVMSYGLYRIARASALSYAAGTQGAIVGQSIFTGLAFLALLAICALAPALTAGAISSEHERKTFDMLAATPLRPASVLFGKLAASLGYVVLLLLATVPLVSLSYLFGGVALIDMLQTLLLLLGYALTFSVIGLFFSTLFRRTARATIASYLVLAAFVIGTTFFYAVVGAVTQQQPPNWLLAFNPFSALASALVNPAAPDLFYQGGPLTSLIWLVSSGGGFDPRAGSGILWQYTIGAYAWLTLALYLLSMQLVKPVRRFRLSRRGWVGFVAFVVLSIVWVLVIYGPLKPDRILAWLRWQATPARDLVANGKFPEPLEPTWAMSTEVEHAAESGGGATLIGAGGRSAIRFSREGAGHAETRITQVISQAVPVNGWLQLRIVLRVDSHDVAMCGVLGSECPMSVRLAYEGIDGQTHYWQQGFYATEDTSGNMPPFCTSCEASPSHIRAPEGEWYTFESGNLLQDLSASGLMPPRFIHSITLAAAGHSYEAQVAEVSLLVRESRPPDDGSVNLPWATPTPFFFPQGMIINDFRSGILGVPVPTPAPPPSIP